MTRRSQSSFDGIPVTKPKARFTGSFELEEPEYEHTPLDNTVVCVVVAKIGNLNIKVTDTEVEATRVFKVSEMRLLEPGELKQRVVQELGLYGLDTLPFNEHTVPKPSPAPVVEPLPEDRDVETGEIFVPPPRDDGEGPKVARFQIDDIDTGGPPADREVIGSVHSGTRDPALASFLGAD